MLEGLKTLAIDGIDLKQLSINGVMAWVEPPSFTNWVPISIDTDGSIFNGCGYQDDMRLSSGGTLKGKNNSVVTGFIKAKGGDTIRVAGVNWVATNHNSNYLNAYDASFANLGARVSNGNVYGTIIVESVVAEGEMAVIKLAALDNIAYIRVSSCGDDTKQEDGSKMIVTVNEEIV